MWAPHQKRQDPCLGRGIHGELPDALWRGGAARGWLAPGCGPAWDWGGCRGSAGAAVSRPTAGLVQPQEGSHLGPRAQAGREEVGRGEGLRARGRFLTSSVHTHPHPQPPGRRETLQTWDGHVAARSTGAALDGDRGRKGARGGRAYLVGGDVRVRREGQHAHDLPDLVQLAPLGLAEVFPGVSTRQRLFCSVCVRLPEPQRRLPSVTWAGVCGKRSSPGPTPPEGPGWDSVRCTSEHPPETPETVTSPSGTLVYTNPDPKDPHCTRTR